MICRTRKDQMRTWKHTLTVDASVDAAEKVAGIGIVIQQRSGRRKRGPIVARISELHRGIRLNAAEEFAVLRALEVAIERGFSRVKIRSDYNQMRRALREQYRQRRMADGDELRRRVMTLADLFEFVHFAWVPRRRNQIAHGLARHALHGTAPDASDTDPAQSPPANATVGAVNVGIR